MRRAACFFVVRAEYQGGILHAAGDNAPARPAGGLTDRTNCPDKIRFAKSGRGWYNSYNCAAFCAGKVRS
mgnify:FL=1